MGIKNILFLAFAAMGAYAVSRGVYDYWLYKRGLILPADYFLKNADGFVLSDEVDFHFGGSGKSGGGAGGGF
jgi:hypothetical protein